MSMIWMKAIMPSSFAERLVAQVVRSGCAERVDRGAELREVLGAVRAPGQVLLQARAASQALDQPAVVVHRSEGYDNSARPDRGTAPRRLAPSRVSSTVCVMAALLLRTGRVSGAVRRRRARVTCPR